MPSSKAVIQSSQKPGIRSFGFFSPSNMKPVKSKIMMIIDTKIRRNYNQTEGIGTRHTFLLRYLSDPNYLISRHPFQ